MRTTTPLDNQPAIERVSLWVARSHNLNGLPPHEGLPPGANQEWAIWKSLNRLRSGVGRTKDNLAKWHLLKEPSALSRCGAEQTMQRLYVCPQCPASCTMEDLLNATENAVAVARFWSRDI